jgi:hypothetical protein
MGTREWIDPVEAARIVLRKTCPEIAEIFSAVWYQRPVVHKATQQQREAARASLDNIREWLRQGDVDAQGLFNGGGQPVPINAPAFVRPFSIFDEPLDLTIPGHAPRIYHQWQINRTRMQALAKNLGPTTREPHAGELLDMAKDHWSRPAPDMGRFEKEVRARGLRAKRDEVRDNYNAARTIPKKRGRRPNTNPPIQSAEK